MSWLADLGIAAVAGVAGYAFAARRTSARGSGARVGGARASGLARIGATDASHGATASASAAVNSATVQTQHPGADVASNNAFDTTREIEQGIALVCSSVGAVAGTLWRVEPDGDAARPAASFGRQSPAARPLRGDPMGWVAREGTPVRLDPTPSWASDDVRVFALRLFQRENRGWILTVEVPLDDDVDVARIDAAAASLRLLVELQERRGETAADRRRLNSLLEVLRRIPVATELVPAADDLIAACMRLVDATGGAVGLWNGSIGEIVCVRGPDGGPAQGASFASPASEMALAVRAEGPLVRTNGSWKPGATQMANQLDRWNARPRSFVVMPLATSSGTTAVLALWSSAHKTLDTAGIDLVLAVAPYAALHLEHAREFGRMKETAETDGLTGLRNRRAFDAALQLESSRYERYGRPLSLLMIDMDHFKSVNDRLGHEAGDEVLRRVATIVRSCVRDVDTAARFGGEELAVLLPETTLAAAREVAERIRVTIQGAPVRWQQDTIPVTVSIGLSCVPEGVASAGALLATADEALYTAKNGGRNRVC
jgi:diguanylate cyclase (GGDEF)-like protein